MGASVSKADINRLQDEIDERLSVVENSNSNSLKSGDLDRLKTDLKTEITRSATKTDLTTLESDMRAKLTALETRAQVAGPIGPPGPAGSVENLPTQVEAYLKDKRSLWCSADGTVCSLPDKKTLNMNTVINHNAASQMSHMLARTTVDGGKRFTLEASNDVMQVATYDTSGQFNSYHPIKMYREEKKVELTNPVLLGKVDLGNNWNVSSTADKLCFKTGDKAAMCVSKNGIELRDDWKLHVADPGDQIFFSKHSVDGDGRVMRLGTGGDVMNIYQNRDGKAPFTYVNPNTSGLWDGTNHQWTLNNNGDVYARNKLVADSHIYTKGWVDAVGDVTGQNIFAREKIEGGFINSRGDVAGQNINARNNVTGKNIIF